MLDGSGIEILRTAFADVCLWQNERFIWLNVHAKIATELLPSAEILFDSSLIRKSFRDNVLLQRLFIYARRAQGKINRDECYGFAPLPALGGAMKNEYIVKFELREYIALLAGVNNKGI